MFGRNMESKTSQKMLAKNPEKAQTLTP